MAKAKKNTEKPKTKVAGVKAQKKAPKRSITKKPVQAASLANLAPAWKPGQTGNPNGRPKGLRNAVSQQFLNDMLTVWNEANSEGNHTGLDAIRVIAKDKPAQFITAMGNLVPRELSFDDEATEGFMGIWQALAKASASKEA